MLTRCNYTSDSEDKEENAREDTNSDSYIVGESAHDIETSMYVDTEVSKSICRCSLRSKLQY